MGNKHTFLYLMIFQQFKTRDKKKEEQICTKVKQTQKY